jgi:hypothetical protein
MGVLQLEQVLQPAAQSACLLAVALTAAADGPAALHIGSAGSFRVSCNGVEVGARDVERQFAFDQDAVVLPLLAGPNLLLVKLCHQESGEFQAALRLSAPDGGPLAGVRASIELPVLERAAACGARSPWTARQGARSRIVAARGLPAWLAHCTATRGRQRADRADKLAARAQPAAAGRARLLLATTRAPGPQPRRHRRQRTAPTWRRCRRPAARRNHPPRSPAARRHRLRRPNSWHGGAREVEPDALPPRAAARRRCAPRA